MCIYNAGGESFLWSVNDSIGFLKSSISETVNNWNTKLQDFMTLRKREEKQAKVKF